MIPLPAWIRDYDRSALRPDIVAGLVIWSVVVPQAVAYAQIAGLPPEAGLMAAPGALVAYALLGTSRTLVVSATTATSAVSAAAVAPLAGGDPAAFAALSAALALVAAIVLIAAGSLRLGAISDLVSKPVMTGFLFGVGLTIMAAQLPSLLGVEASVGNFFGRVGDLVGALGGVDVATVVVGVLSIAILVAGRAIAPTFPTTLVLLVVAIAASAALGLSAQGVDVVGSIPSALPDPSLPGVSASDLLALVGAGFGVMLVSTEAVGVSRAIATRDGYSVDPNRDLVALGGANLLAGLSGGFVQSGGASQTMAAERAGGRTQLTSIVCAVLVLATGAFLAPLFTELPQATLAAIVIVAIASFLDVGELRRIAAIRRSALVFASITLVAVLALGVLQGLVFAAGLSLVYLVKRISRPAVSMLARNPDTGTWSAIDDHPGWRAPAAAIVVRSSAPLVFANVVNVRDRITAMAERAEPPPRLVVLDLSTSGDIDVETADELEQLRVTLERVGVELRLAAVHERSSRILERTAIGDRVRFDPTVDDALAG